MQAICLVASKENAAWIGRVGTPDTQQRCDPLKPHNSSCEWSHECTHWDIRPQVRFLRSVLDAFRHVPYSVLLTDSSIMTQVCLKQSSCHLHPDTNAKARKMIRVEYEMLSLWLLPARFQVMFLSQVDFDHSAEKMRTNEVNRGTLNSVTKTTRSWFNQI